MTSRVDQALAVVDRDGGTEVEQVLDEEVRRLRETKLVRAMRDLGALCSDDERHRAWMAYLGFAPAPDSAFSVDDPGRMAELYLAELRR